MTALLEQPLVVLFVGSLFVAVAAIAWVQTQHPRALLALTLAVVGLATALAVEYFVVTPAEQVEARLHGVARALESNHIETVLTFVAQDATELQNEIRQAMQMARIKKISIKSNLHVQMGASGNSAEAKFNAVATFYGSGAEIPVPRRLVVHYRRENGDWQITDYQAFDPRGQQLPRGLRNIQ